jgi:hypothetical protein
MPATNSASSLDAVEGKRVSLKASLRTKVSEVVDPSVESTQIFDASCIRAGLSNDDIADVALVHKSAVSKWRSEHYTDSPNFTQMVRLARKFPLFSIALHRVLGMRYGMRRSAMRSLLEAVADLAVFEDDEQERTG